MIKLILVILLLLSIYMVVVGVVSLVTSRPLRESNKYVWSLLFPTYKRTTNVKVIIDELFVLRFDEIVCRNSELKTCIYNKREIQLENGIHGFEIEFHGSLRSAKICLEELKQLITEHFFVQSFAIYCIGEYIALRDGEYRLRVYYAVGDRVPLLRAYEEKTRMLKDSKERKRAEKNMQLEKPIGVVSLGNNENE